MAVLQQAKIDAPDDPDAVEEAEKPAPPQVVRVTFRGEDLGTFSDRRMTTSESILMKQRTKLSTKEFLEGIGELDGAAMNALVWLMKFRKGETVDVKTLSFEYGELELEREPDPTTPTSGIGGSAT